MASNTRQIASPLLTVPSHAKHSARGNMHRPYRMQYRRDPEDNRVGWWHNEYNLLAMSCELEGLLRYSTDSYTDLEAGSTQKGKTVVDKRVNINVERVAPPHIKPAWHT